MVTNAKVYDVRDFGAKADGITLDSPAINMAIEKAAADGGGTVLLPTGTYLSYSIRLKSHIELRFEVGAKLVAAQEKDGQGYDAAEPGPTPQYQDFGHSHWQNSLIWGIGLEDVCISGPGLIDGHNLNGGFGDTALLPGVGNKAISLKDCKRVVLRDFCVFYGGHFVLLATGVDGLLIDGVTADTDRDGFDIDCCRNVRVSNCLVNSTFDDGIVLKASYALERFVDTRDVTISNCNISAYACGSVLEGTYRPRPEINPHNGKPSANRAGGRIKLGTETSGGFKNIAITNCSFAYCGGILVESMDGGIVEDIVISNCTMRDCIDTPLFFRLGARMRSPEGTPVGTLKRVLVSDLNCWNSTSVHGIQLTGIPGHCIENVTLRNIHVNFDGGYGKASALKTVPENEKSYPDPWMFGSRGLSPAGPAVVMPAKGMFLRHVRGITVDGMHFSYNAPDDRELIITEDASNLNFRDITLDGERYHNEEKGPHRR